MFKSKMLKLLALLFSFALIAAACGDDDDSDTASEPAADDGSADDGASDDGDAAVDSSTICDTDALVAAVEGGPEEGTLSGMTDDPVGTAASNNPVLTTLVTAVGEANLVDTLNDAEALTVFAPTDCAFAEMDQATLEAALADVDLLTSVLGFHVVAGQQLTADDLAGVTELETFLGETLSVSVDGDTVTVGGQSTVLVPNIMTANATVHLIDTVMLPPSVTEG